MRWGLFIVLFSQLSFGQDAPFSDLDTIFLDENWVKTEKRSEAVYYRSIRFSESDTILRIEDYYIETHSLQMTGIYVYEMKSNNQHGPFVFFYMNGNTKAKYHFVMGKIHGKVYKYFENGNPQSVETYANGWRRDTIQSWYENGNPKMVQVINPAFDKREKEEAKKEMILVSAWDEDGNQQVSNGTGRYILYGIKGRKELQIDYSDGFPHGEWIRYVPGKKKVACKMTFKAGRFIKGILFETGKKDIFASLYRPPRYPQGIKALDAFVKRHTGKCEYQIANDVQVILNISKEGKAEFEQIIEGDVSPCQLDEIYELVDVMPNWIPAIKDGYYTESSQVIRINF